jgi:thiol-disulfide isomerase/thioredoxin
MKKTMLAGAITGLLTLPAFTGSFAQHKPAVKADDSTIAALKQEVEKYPDSLPLHKDYIDAMTLANPDLTTQYNAWMEKYPSSYKVPFAIGNALYHREDPAATPYLKKVVAMKPQMAEVWQMLSSDAERWGDEKAAHEYMGKAKQAAPNDPSYAFYYAMDFEHTDPKKWREEIYTVAKRFPDHERGAQGLYWLATRSTDRAEKFKVYEQLIKLYDPLKFSWSSGGASGLFDLYVNEGMYEKALALASKMKSKDGWKNQLELVTNLKKLKELKAAGKLKEALALANTIKVPRYSGAAEYVNLLKAGIADASGNTRAAYDSLLIIYAKTPTEKTKGAIGNYASKLGLNEGQVDEDVWSARKKNMYQAPPFSLDMYTEKRKASLDEYKGKVVLLTFWFPGCGPCRGEFPHFQEVVNKYDKNELAYIGINVFPEQDDYVVPFMKGTGYTFTPLRSTADWAQEVYKVRGQPTNFLIDKEGNIVYSNFMINSNNQRMLELMIESLLKRS